MQCLILSGGLGTRMQHVSGAKPKALLPVGKATFIDYQLQWLKKLGVTEAIIALGHESQSIESHIEHKKKDFSFPKILYSYDGPKLLGTGGAIKNARASLNETFMVTYGDSFLFLDLQDFYNQFKKSKRPLSLAILKNENAGDKSNVIFKDGQLIKYDKKHSLREMTYIDYGISYLNRDYFLSHTPNGAFDFADFISETVEQNQAHGYVVEKMFHEVGSPEGYQRFLKLMESNSYSLESVKLSF